MRARTWTTIAPTTLDSLLADPLVRLTMASDGVTEDDIRTLFVDAKAGIRAQASCVRGDDAEAFRPHA